ncbi:unannotated protein [freshwater metagenome]|uniref:Unannotated protein n=1 Tax=freshwater metagenome TaxID=449393 RepID=A0A6J6ABT2_9ZZZZ
MSVGRFAFPAGSERLPGMNATGLIGYVASAFVVLSLAMTSVVRLRMISLVGALAFIVYGVRLGSPPIVVTNGSILLQ